jgi:hypothetical protein
MVSAAEMIADQQESDAAAVVAFLEQQLVVAKRKLHLASTEAQHLRRERKAAEFYTFPENA